MSLAFLSQASEAVGSFKPRGGTALSELFCCFVSSCLTICWYEEYIFESNETFDGSVIEDKNDLVMFSDRIITKKVFNVAEEDNSDPLFDTMKAESEVEVFFEVKEDQDDNIIE